ncbi:hypothetical protein OS493_039664 [Desmophyllum pertusum]|uniref:Uncharacterized protein n=1 Tax=Desmophyllum pertusum TaxID=174260 RepID=A0A9W9ZH56_9CNID|nr:hypothetical protein OS493_039664 [Desmophyllum pertusum]
MARLVLGYSLRRVNTTRKLGPSRRKRGSGTNQRATGSRMAITWKSWIYSIVGECRKFSTFNKTRAWYHIHKNSLLELDAV